MGLLVQVFVSFFSGCRREVADVHKPLRIQSTTNLGVSAALYYNCARLRSSRL